MRLKLKGLRNHLHKGPLWAQFEDGRVAVLEQGKVTQVEEDLGYKLLEKYPDILERVKAVSKPKADMNKQLTKYRNKMLVVNEDK